VLLRGPDQAAASQLGGDVLAEMGGDVLALSPADFAKLIAEETEKWGKVIQAANIKAE
jgi:hypothetical protein